MTLMVKNYVRCVRAACVGFFAPLRRVASKREAAYKSDANKSPPRREPRGAPGPAAPSTLRYRSRGEKMRLELRIVERDQEHDHDQPQHVLEFAREGDEHVQPEANDCVSAGASSMSFAWGTLVLNCSQPLGHAACQVC